MTNKEIADLRKSHPGWEYYMIDYDHGGRSYSFEIPAESFQDAHARLQSLRMSGRVEGQLDGVFDTNLGAGLWVRLLVWWKNLRRAA